MRKRREYYARLEREAWEKATEARELEIATREIREESLERMEQEREEARLGFLEKMETDPRLPILNCPNEAYVQALSTAMTYDVVGHAAAGIASKVVHRARRHAQDLKKLEPNPNPNPNRKARSRPQEIRAN